MAQLYVLRGVETGKVKIGITENFGCRLTNYRVHCAEPLTVMTLFEVGGDREVAAIVEASILRKYAGSVTHGEWLSPTPEFLEQLHRLKDYYEGLGGAPLSAVAETQPIIKTRACGINWSRIGQRTKQLRILKRMTQQKVAERASVSQATVSRLESGSQRGITVDALDAIVSGSGGELIVEVSGTDAGNRDFAEDL